jgi:hypothetical protein
VRNLIKKLQYSKIYHHVDSDEIHYYINNRVNQALNSSKDYLSIVTDGMAQQHCLLPWSANLYQFPKHLSQHLQGVLAHGRHLRMYRTFHNVSNGTNLQIHTFLLILQEIFDNDGKSVMRALFVRRNTWLLILLNCFKYIGFLPDTVYLQVDGGSENTAKAVLYMCELIVIKRLCKKIVLTRLMVGHTHCDIDAVFGRLWKRIRNKPVLTPAAYSECVENSLSTSAYKAKIVDIFVVPDYVKYFENCGDKQFGSYSKTDNTKHQFCFEAIERCENFPLGVKTTYRAYSADEVVEIYQEKNGVIGQLNVRRSR